MKAFKNIKTYEGAKRFFVSCGFDKPFSSFIEGREEEPLNRLVSIMFFGDDVHKELEVIGKRYLAFALSCFHKSANSAVRAAIHRELLGPRIGIKYEDYSNDRLVPLAFIVSLETGVAYGHKVIGERY